MFSGIALCVSGDFGSRCILQYPPSIQQSNTVINVQHNNNSRVSGNILSSPHTSTQTEKSKTDILGMSNDMFATVFCAKSTESNENPIPYNVKVNEYQYISTPVWLPYTHNVIHNNNGKDSVDNDINDSMDSISMFNIVFVCQELSAQLIEQYNELSAQLISALQHEQHRCQFVSEQAILLLNIMEQYMIDHDIVEISDNTVVIDMMCQQSLLGRHIKDLYTTLIECNNNNSSIVHIHVNNWIHVYCSIYTSDIHNSISTTDIQPYHTLLLRRRNQEILQQLSADCSPLLRTFIKSIQPNIRFSELAALLQLPLHTVYRLASHLIHWHQAYIIDVIDVHNIYVPANITITTHIQQQWTDTFGQSPHIYHILAQLSIQQSLGIHRSQQTVTNQQIAFLLRAGAIEQIHQHKFARSGASKQIVPATTKLHEPSQLKYYV